MKKTLLTIAAVLLTTTTASAELTPATYFEIEVKARELMISGMEERLACMQNPDCPDNQAAEIDESAQSAILNMHMEYDTTPSLVAGYYTNNSQAVDDYFRYNIDLQVTLNQLTDSYESISDAITPLLEAR